MLKTLYVSNDAKRLGDISFDNYKSVGNLAVKEAICKENLLNVTQTFSLNK